MATITEQLLLFLADKNDGIPLVHIPRDLLNPDLLTVCDSERLIEFGEVSSFRVGNDEPQIDGDTVRHWGSKTAPGYKPMAEILADVVRDNCDPRLRVHVRLTGQGRAEVSRARVSTYLPRDGEAAEAARLRPVGTRQEKSYKLYYAALDIAPEDLSGEYKEVWAWLKEKQDAGGDIDGLPDNPETFARYIRATAKDRGEPPPRRGSPNVTKDGRSVVDPDEW